MTTTKCWYSVCFTATAALILAGGGVLGVPAQAAGQATPAAAQATAPTFSKDIAPVLQRSCQHCHRPGGGAPMALTTYEQVRPWARAIKQKTTVREMPPWYIEKNVGVQQFKDDPSLSDEEIAMIGVWVDAGAPQGNPADMPPPRQFPASGAWTLGTPDMVVTSKMTTVKARGSDWYGDLGFSPSGLTEDRYVKAVEVREFRPNETGIRRTTGAKAGDFNLFVVHHAVTTTSCTYAGSEVCNPEGEGGQGVSVRRARGEENALPRGDYSFTYEVGMNPMIYPAEFGVRLPAGANIYFPNNHLHSIGREVQVQVQIGFYFHPTGYQPKYPRGVSALTGQSQVIELDIPAGEENARVEGFTTLQHPAKLVTYEPHMHASGTRMCAQAILPSGQIATISCAGYNHNWVRGYVYEDDAAPLLPKGTIIHTIGWYDNSSKNPRNADPRNWKGFGQRSVDDMFLNQSQLIWLTEEEYQAEVAAREARQRRSTATQTARR